ncbi:MAG: BatA domain-containing protein, partial [Planctomycetota bacterium]|nr:BatA domain-containing protein [Planctomycetota bacterium]
MIFGAPWMLAALPLVAVPVIIHLLQRRRFRRVEFAAMEFLRRAMKRMRRRVLLEDVLLLALRTLAVLAIILALARPSAERPPGWLAEAARSEIVILDSSLSMNHRSGGQTVFERASALAERMFEAADPQRGARAALILAGIRAERLAAGEPTAALAALQQLEGAGSGGADLNAALAIALRTAEDFLLDAPPRVTVLTDLQAYAWDLAGDGAAALARLVQAGVPVELVDAGARERDNVAVIALELPAKRLVLGDSADAIATIRNFGAASAEVHAEALLDGDPIANVTLTLAAGEEVEWPFAVDPRLSGARTLEVRLAHDALIEDDARAVAFELSEALEMVIVGEPALRERTPGVCDALISYFDLGEGSPLRARLLAPG